MQATSRTFKILWPMLYHAITYPFCSQRYRMQTPARPKSQQSWWNSWSPASQIGPCRVGGACSAVVCGRFSASHTEDLPVRGEALLGFLFFNGRITIPGLRAALVSICCLFVPARPLCCDNEELPRCSASCSDSLGSGGPSHGWDATAAACSKRGPPERGRQEEPDSPADYARDPPASEGNVGTSSLEGQCVDAVGRGNTLLLRVSAHGGGGFSL